MEFLSAVHTDKGIKKNTNQDSVLIKEAVTDHGKVFFAAVCDGMGGLAKGEVASATLVRAFSDWFENRFRCSCTRRGLRTGSTGSRWKMI